EWETVLSKTEDHFLHKRKNNQHRTWLWNDLKMESYSISCSQDPYQSLELLIHPNEQLFFLLNETINEQTKYWCYEGKLSAIVKVIGNSKLMDEYYLVSKKYDWFLALNHHNVLIGSGSITSRMKAEETQIQS
ncbi:MAG: DUF6756 family protein, partial [Bacteroidota bacterium]